MENNKKIDDKDLKKVNGGSNLDIHYYSKAEDVKFIFNVGDVIRVDEGIFSSEVECVVVSREVFADPQYGTYEDLYIVRETGGKHLLRRVLRDDIVNMASKY